MMSSLLVVFICFLINFVSNGVMATIPPDGVFDENGRYIANHQETNCCIVPDCDEYNQCFRSIKCGYICSQGPYSPYTSDSTPGFFLKESYTKLDCHFGTCQNYKFLCKHCPDPKEENFNIYLVRRGCRDCYYKKE